MPIPKQIEEALERKGFTRIGRPDSENSFAAYERNQQLGTEQVLISYQPDGSLRLRYSGSIGEQVNKNAVSDESYKSRILEILGINSSSQTK